MLSTKAPSSNGYRVIALTLALLGCGDPVAPEDNFAGTYRLQTVNGQSLPYVVAQSGQNTVAITSDQMVIADGGSWSEVITYRLIENGAMRTETSSDGGAWVRVGTTLNLYSGTATTTTYSGSITANALTFTDASFTQVFVKER